MRIFLFFNFTHRLYSLRQEDEGRYVCVASNDGGTKRAYVYLVIEGIQHFPLDESCFKLFIDLLCLWPTHFQKTVTGDEMRLHLDVGSQYWLYSV